MIRRDALKKAITVALMVASTCTATAMNPNQDLDVSSIPLAVLGDSDSHSYQDRISFPPGSAARGGPYRQATFQWTEALARLRGQELDLGAWGIWGSREKLAHVLELVGWRQRLPRKEDYRHNFAVSGAQCEDLMQGDRRQAPRLLEVMNEDPAYWRKGVIVIQIGTNSFGKATSLDRLAEDPASPEVQATIRECLHLIETTVSLIHGSHPQARFVLVGIFDNAHWAKYLNRWHSPGQLAHISEGLDRFDERLRALARSDSRLAFFDERAWFSKRWGSRGSDGLPAYATVDLQQGWTVANTYGDDPRNAVLADGHPGLVWNALWVQDLLDVMNSRFGLGLRPLEQGELVQYLNPGFR